MKKLWTVRLLSLLTAGVAVVVTGASVAAVVGMTALDASSVTTAGTPVTAVAANTSYSGCYITNDPLSTTNIVVDALHVANHTTPSATASILTPNQTYICPGGMGGLTVTVDSSDNAHKFYGAKY